MVKTIVVAGGATFLGSHLVDALVRSGQEVVVLDDLSTGRLAFLSDAIGSGRVTFAYTAADAPATTLDAVLSREVGPFVDELYDCTAAGWPALAELARRHDARLVRVVVAGPGVDSDEIVASTLVRNGGRFVDACAVRVFDCFGPRMETDVHPVARILEQAVSGGPIRVERNAVVTPLYIDDAIGLIRRAADGPTKHAVIDAAHHEPIELPDLARVVVAACRLTCDVQLADDSGAQPPMLDRPNLDLARSLAWTPATPLAAGLRSTFGWFAAESRMYV